jgi:hypothetical protein
MSYIYNAFKERILDETASTDFWLASGNSIVLDGSTYDYGIVTGVHDPAHYPALDQHEVDELWKCQNCGRVYRMKDTLECKSCGSPITEGSRFVLEK